MTSQSKAKIVKVNLRVTAEEMKLMTMLAEREGASISEFLRNAVLTMSEIYLENKEFLSSLPDKDKVNAVGMLKALIIENQEIAANSIKGSHEDLLERIERVEKLIGVFVYVYLFHTPEVTESKKKQAKESAVDRV